MILTTNNPETFSQKYAETIAESRLELIEAQKRELRLLFDNTVMDYKAHAYIGLAKELGFTELAAQMENDLIVEQLLAS